jgi:hypothetical protein
MCREQKIKSFHVREQEKEKSFQYLIAQLRKKRAFELFGFSGYHELFGEESPDELP